MRVRIRRFVELRSRGEPGNAQPVEVRLRQHDVNRVGRMVPPPLTPNPHPPREFLRGSASAELRMGSLGRLRRIHSSRLRKISGVSAMRKYARQPVRYRLSSSTTWRTLRPRLRPVISRARFFIASRALSATRRRNLPPAPRQNAIPRNSRVSTRATAVFSSLMRSRRSPYWSHGRSLSSSFGPSPRGSTAITASADFSLRRSRDVALSGTRRDLPR